MPLGSRLALSLALSLTAAACGDNVSPPADPDGPIAPQPDAPPAVTCNDTAPDESLRLIPGVVSVTESACGQFVAQPAICYLIEFEQPLTAGDPDTNKLTQRLYLTHRGCTNPTLIADWGYSWEFFYDDELTTLFQTNSLWVEHRYQGESLPAIADWDWTALTIENGATDLHRIITAFKSMYGGNWVSTGASKGGITATYHKYFFPDDLDGTVPYVAPASRARIDPAYQDNLDAVLTSPCANRMRNTQVAALTSRRPMMIQRIGELFGPGFEAEILEQVTESLDWGFWQRYGVASCGDVPIAAATDDVFWQFFLDYSGLQFAQDGPAGAAANDQMSYGALYYEWLTEHGFALQIGAHVLPLLEQPSALMTMEDTFHQQFPTVDLPAYDGSVTAAVRTWVRDTADDVLLIYGQFDPWSGGAMDQPTRPTSGRFYVPEATHGAQISALPPAEQDAALALAAAMFGRDPVDAKPAARRAGEVRDALLWQAEQRALAWRFRRGR